MTTPETSSQPKLPEVASFETHRHALIVKFEDGHEMVTRRNTGGWSSTDAIATFSLRRDKDEVARYQSPYQYPRNTDSRNGFVVLNPDYNVARVAEYWSSANSHIRALVDDAGGLANLLRQDEPTYKAFILLSHGHIDLNDVVTGNVEVHVS